MAQPSLCGLQFASAMTNVMELPSFFFFFVGGTILVCQCFTFCDIVGYFLYESLIISAAFLAAAVMLPEYFRSDVSWPGLHHIYSGSLRPWKSSIVCSDLFLRTCWLHIQTCQKLLMICVPGNICEPQQLSCCLPTSSGLRPILMW